MELKATKLILDTFDDDFCNLIQLILTCILVLFLFKELAQLIVFGISRKLALREVPAMCALICLLQQGHDIIDNPLSVVRLLGLFDLGYDINAAITALVIFIDIINFNGLTLAFLVSDDGVALLSRRFRPINLLVRLDNLLTNVIVLLLLILLEHLWI